MDPNVALAEIRRLAATILPDEDQLTDAVALAELVTWLDEWLATGGFLPEAWAR
jgi:hypothetical protein